MEHHLSQVAALAEAFAAAFGAGEWGRLAGLWHDLGKYAGHFQHYLRRSAALEANDPHRLELRGSVDHSTAGALHATQAMPRMGRVLAYCIAGHHVGLPNTVAAEGECSSLEDRLRHPRPEAQDALAHAPASLLRQPEPAPLALSLSRGDARAASFQLAFFTRMLFSCLVDADFLATERFMAPERAGERPTDPPTMADLAAALDQHLHELRSNAGDSTVNRMRNRVLDACINTVAQPPGLFALNVPTGGGKTLSSLAFALRHAATHDLRRVIVAIPFTSIIEQNAAVYRQALGPFAEHVLEHHSNLDVRGEDQETVRSRLAAENWDAPVVVTTNVQLFESLFANRTSRCRKLHRIAGSVIVLDEAQALPPNLLAPTLAALRELVTNYGCSVVLCTATQPALERRPEFDIGLDQPRPIIAEADRDALFAALARVQVEKGGVIRDTELVERLADEPQVLCIVNTRGHAAALFEALTERLGETQAVRRDGVEVPRVGSCLHLSANMCPRHRSAVLRLIRRRLTKGRPCRVISTQLVEAGVDVDFPVVYRAMAGLDSIAQAAGRCNREGKLSTKGRVVIFEPDAQERRLPSFVRPAVNAAAQVLPDHADPLSPAAQHHYFRLHYWDERHRSGWDRPPGAGDGAGGVLDCFGNGGNYLQFREAAARYRLIADDQQPILVPYGRRGQRLVRQLHAMTEPPGIGFDRHLQRFVVTLHEHAIAALASNALLHPPEHTHGRHVLGNPGAYDRRLGLRMDTAGLAPETLMI